MAMRKDQIPDNKFTLPLDARELALYTRQITKNAKVFDLEIDASLPGQLRATADRIFFDIFGANDLRLDKPNEREERFKLQRHAVRLCTVLLAEIDMAKPATTFLANGALSGATLCAISGSVAGTGTRVMQSVQKRFDIKMAVG